MARKRKAEGAKVPVSERALLQRVNRRLAKDNEQLRTARGFRDGLYRHEDSTLGRYYAVDLSRNVVTAAHIDLEKWGRELEVLKPWEVLQD
jgi:hypothetical protein